MSKTNHLRNEENCLNCGALVEGKFCSECGQLNREPSLSVRDLLHDLLHSVLHFDGKFFATIKYLVTKPGFLTKEYISGKRVKYLPPVQMYLFTSAVFYFLIYSFFIHPIKKDEVVDAKQKTEIENSLKINIKDSSDNFKSIEEYHQEQAVMSADKKDGAIKKYFKELQLALNKKFLQDPKSFFIELIDLFIHSFSSLFFVSLPLIALWLNIIFFNKKEFNLVSHFLFITHNYIFNYVAIFCNLILKSIASIKGLGFIEYMATFLLLWIPFYGYFSMKNFYGLSRRKTIWKFTLALTGSFFIFIVLIIIYLLLSIIKLK